MPRKLYVGNLSHAVQQDELERLFAHHGTVRSAEVTNQLQTADITGTGLVEMDSEAQGEGAIAALNGMQHSGSTLVVCWATPGQRKGINLSRMFESMNIPAEGEGAVAPRFRGRKFVTNNYLAAGRMGTQTLGAHRATYDAVFQHPVPRDLAWRDVRSMLGALADDTEEHDGHLKFTRNGRTLIVGPPRHEGFSDAEQLTEVRHFLVRSGTPARPAAVVGRHAIARTTDKPGERIRARPEERFASPAQTFDLDAVARDLAAEPTTTAQGHRQRMLFRRGDATLSLFLFEAGAALREHRTNGTVLIQVLQGRMTVRAGGERHDLPGGSVLSMAAGVPHDVYADVASRMLLTVYLQPAVTDGMGA